MSRHAEGAPKPFLAFPDDASEGAPLDLTLLETVRQNVLAHAGPLTDQRVAAAVRDSGRLLGTAGSLQAMDRIGAELNGLGPLQRLVLDPAVTDIFVNGPKSVWLDRGYGPEPADVAFDGEAAVRALAVRLTSVGGRRLDDSSPCVDVKIEPGYRVHAVLPPISPLGTIISIRVRRKRALTVDGLVQANALHPEFERLLRAVISQRLSFLISGATGAGKTTLLSALLGLCEPRERLVLIEDAAELEPEHGHFLTLEARHSNAEGAGTIGLDELVRQALRMNPGRLIVGECRGSEVRELLMALNTGHTGGCGTIHANSAEDVPARLAALGVLAGMSQDAIALQASSALDVVVHVRRVGSRRVVSEIAVMTLTKGVLVAVPALKMIPSRIPVADTGPEDFHAASARTNATSWLGWQLQPGPGWPELAARLGLE